MSTHFGCEFKRVEKPMVGNGWGNPANVAVSKGCVFTVINFCTMQLCAINTHTRRLLFCCWKKNYYVILLKNKIDKNIFFKIRTF